MCDVVGQQVDDYDFCDDQVDFDDGGQIQFLFESDEFDY